MKRNPLPTLACAFASLLAAIFTVYASADIGSVDEQVPLSFAAPLNAFCIAQAPGQT
jgi:hypothetical protein